MPMSDDACIQYAPHVISPRLPGPTERMKAKPTISTVRQSEQASASFCRQLMRMRQMILTGKVMTF